MNRKSSQRRSQSTAKPINRQRPNQSTRESLSQKWQELRSGDREPSIALNDFIRLIERDAPLQTNAALVLMYGPFQAEMQSDRVQGVASWLRECVGKHGIPSLIRFDHRRRAQIFRRDQFETWLEPMACKIPS